MNFFTSDPHFWHRNIIEYCKRPFLSVEEMNAVIITNWNMVVQPTDLVYLLGDFCFGQLEKYEEILSQLKGQIIFIRGNHDKKLGRLKTITIHEDLRIFSEHGLIYLNHRPQPKEKWSDCQYHFCGHVHDSWKRRGNIINVGMDQWNFRPVTLENLLTSSSEVLS